MAHNFYPERTDDRGLVKNARALETLLDLLTDADGEPLVLLLDGSNDPLTGDLGVAHAGHVILLLESLDTGRVVVDLKDANQFWRIGKAPDDTFVWTDVTAGTVPIVVLKGVPSSSLRLEPLGVSFFAGGSFGGGVGVVFIANATTVPTTNPANGAILYCADVGASSELFARNENGDVARLTGNLSRLAADANSTSTTLADVALSARVESGKTYHLIATLICDTAGTDGIDVRLASTATTTGVMGINETFGLSLSIPGGGRQSSFPATFGVGHATGSFTGHVSARITFTTTSAGVVKVQLARIGAAGTATVKAGSVLTLNEVG